MITNRIAAYYWEFRYRLLKRFWLITRRIGSINGLVLMYHHVTDERIDEYDTCQHSLKDFIHSIETTVAGGYEFVSIDDAIKLLENKSDKKFAIVTFDDVPESVYFNAYPYLRKKEIPFCLFITLDYLDKKGFLSIKEINEMRTSGLCTIGAHTITHPMLRQSINWKVEISKPKIELERLFGEKIKYLAFPYGRQSAVSNRIRKYTKRCGYECAFSTIAAPVTLVSTINRFFIPRIVIK